MKVLLKNQETGLFYSKSKGQHGFTAVAGEATPLTKTEASFVRAQFDGKIGSLPYIVKVNANKPKSANRTMPKLDNIIRTADLLRKLVEKEGLDGDPIVDEAAAKIDNDLDDLLFMLQS